MMWNLIILHGDEVSIKRKWSPVPKVLFHPHPHPPHHSHNLLLPQLSQFSYLAYSSTLS